MQLEDQKLQSQVELKEVSEKTLERVFNQSPGRRLSDLQINPSEICKSALFEVFLRRCIRRLQDACEMHPCRLEMLTNLLKLT